MAKLIRNRAKNMVSNSKLNEYDEKDYLIDVLGPQKFFRDKYENNNFAGVVTGLAGTSVGGEILFIESSLSEGKGNLSITGNFGKIMKESAVIGGENIKSNH
jgi:ATP-dependent Lon protease, bacterial type